MLQNVKEKFELAKEKVKEKVNVKAMAVASVVAMPIATMAAEGTTSSVVDFSGIDFSPVVGTVVAVIGVGIVPMMTIAAAKKGVSLLQSLVKKA